MQTSHTPTEPTRQDHEHLSPEERKVLERIEQQGEGERNGGTAPKRRRRGLPLNLMYLMY